MPARQGRGRLGPMAAGDKERICRSLGRQENRMHPCRSLGVTGAPLVITHLH